MQIIDHLEACGHPPEGAVVTIGNFDGVHLGHRAIIDRLRALAPSDGARTAVVTFEPHTLQVIRPEIAPPRLTTPSRKLELLADCGLDVATVLTFDAARARQSAEDFIEEILVRCLHAKAVMVGDDFRFGAGARGDTALLRAAGESHGFRVEPLPLIKDRDGLVLSSTAARTAVAEARLDEAAAILGRPHDLRGEVIGGDQRGRTIGFPTANIDPGPGRCLPPNGVYATLTRRVGTNDWWPSVTNLGVRPTFRAGDTADARPLIETHVFDRSDDLYGDVLDVAFVAFLRSERRFDGPDALVAQIRTDAAEARAILAGRAVRPAGA